MTGAELRAQLLPGAPELLRAHARELPQRDDLCGAFCAALALGAAGFQEHDGTPLDQDAVALLAGSVIGARADPSILPAGERGRRDYRLTLPTIDDGSLSGTTAQGLVSAVGELTRGGVEAIPLAGPWSEAALAGVFEHAAALERPVSLLANLATHHLWGAGATLTQLLSHLLEGETSGPEPDWDVGHFAVVFGRVSGPGGTLYALADTYPSLGNRGVHMQPAPRLAAAVERSDKPAGGIIAVVAAEDAAGLRAAARALGLQERIWDNGTPPPA